MKPKPAKLGLPVVFALAAIAGWGLGSLQHERSAEAGSDGTARSVRPAPADIASASDRSGPANRLAEDLSAIDRLPDEAQMDEALRIAALAFRRNPEDARAIAQWMRRKWPEQTAKYRSDWELLRGRKEYGYTRHDRMDCLYVVEDFNDLCRASSSLNRDEFSEAWQRIRPAARIDPDGFLKGAKGMLSGPHRQEALYYWPFAEHEGIRHVLLNEALHGPDAVTAANSRPMGLYLQRGAGAEAVGIFAKASDEGWLSKVGGPRIRLLAGMAAEVDPGGVATYLEASEGDVRAELLRGMAEAELPVSSVEDQLSEEERARWAFTVVTRNGAGSEDDLHTYLQWAGAQDASEVSADLERLARYFTSGDAEPAAALESAINDLSGATRDAFVDSLVKRWAAIDVVGATVALAPLERGSVSDNALKAVIAEIGDDPEAVIVWADRLTDREEGYRIATKALRGIPEDSRTGFDAALRRFWPETAQ